MKKLVLNWRLFLRRVLIVLSSGTLMVSCQKPRSDVKPAPDRNAPDYEYGVPIVPDVPFIVPEYGVPIVPMYGIMIVPEYGVQHVPEKE